MKKKEENLNKIKIWCKVEQNAEKRRKKKENKQTIQKY